MDVNFATELVWLRSLSSPMRVRFLSLLSHALTIASRLTLKGAPNEPLFVANLTRLNEAQHQVTGYISACLNRSEHIDFLPGVVTALERASSGPWGSQIFQAWRSARLELGEA